MGNLLSNGTVTVRRHEYAHITNSNTNVVKTIVGPQRYRLSLSESCTFGPEPFVSIPFQCYCVVENPVKHAVGGDGQQPILDEWGQAEIRMGDKEVRTTNVPFPLYPGETITSSRGSRFRPMTVIPANTGLHLRSVLDFVDETTGKVVHAAEEWMEEGPKVYLPRTWVEEVGLVPAHVIEAGCALRLRATSNFTDRHGNERVAGEEWLVRTPGSYLPAVQEHVVETVTGVVLQKACALQLRAKQRFTDVYGKARNAGDMWLVTSSEASVHIPDVHEEVIKVVNRCVLTSNRYCVVLNPVGADGRNRYGEREVRRGECSFFLKPGEELQGGIRDVVPVSRGDALLLKALEPVEVGGVMREPGSEWLLHGPAEDVPSNSVAVVEHRKMITLDKNEGIYVMNKKTGEVRTVIGQPYMPTEEEVLWEKHLPMAVEELLTSPGGSLKTSQRRADFVCTRELHRMVRFNVKHNAAVQIYDYHKKIPRIVFGPDLVMLGPHEELTVLSLSGGTPKAPNAIQSLQLFLGPRFSSDTIIVETSDHARLQLRLSYNWFFDVKQDAKDEEQQKCRCFAVPDFIGDCCKTIASRVRGAVAAEDFDSFHKNSAMIIRTAVFGMDEKGEIRKELRFPANDFVVTNVDVQFAEPTDAKTRDSLQKSVQLAIEITTKSLEATARHGNELKDQEAKGQLERQKLLDKIEVEKAKTKWLELQAKSEAVQASGQSVTEAQAKAEALLIEVDSELKQATLRSQAYKISAESELKKLEQRQAMELDYVRRQNALEIERARRQAESEAEKVRRMVGAVGKDTLVAIARAGPETQAKLLAGLGLRGYLITDGNSPVNLFSAAQSMLGEPGTGHGSDSTSS